MAGVGHPCFVSDLKGKAFRFSLLSMMLAVGLSYVAFIMLSYISCLHYLLSVFIMKGYWTVSNACPTSTEMSMWVLSFVLLI